MSTSIEVSLSDFDTDDIIEEFMERIDLTKPKNGFAKKIIERLREMGYVIVYPKYIVQKSMLEDYITENNLDD